MGLGWAGLGLLINENGKGSGRAVTRSHHTAWDRGSTWHSLGQVESPWFM